MTQQEFTNRTMVEVSAKEFNAINEVYMNSDLDKDEFCKMWVKMNKTRVQNAKIERKWRIREECYRDALHKFYHKTTGQDLWTPICFIKMSVFEIQAMSYAGIKLDNGCGSGAKHLLDVRHEIGKYLGMF